MDKNATVYRHENLSSLFQNLAPVGRNRRPHFWHHGTNGKVQHLTQRPEKAHRVRHPDYGMTATRKGALSSALGEATRSDSSQKRHTVDTEEEGPKKCAYAMVPRLRPVKPVAPDNRELSASRSRRSLRAFSLMLV